MAYGPLGLGDALVHRRGPSAAPLLAKNSSSLPNLDLERLLPDPAWSSPGIQRVDTISTSPLDTPAEQSSAASRSQGVVTSLRSSRNPMPIDRHQVVEHFPRRTACKAHLSAKCTTTDLHDGRSLQVWMLVSDSLDTHHT